MRMTVSELALAAGAHIGAPSPDARVEDVYVTDFTWDSREAGPGCAFAAIVGERVDGHDFLVDVARAGARAAIVSRDVDPDIADEVAHLGMFVLHVADTQRAIVDIAAAWRERLQGVVVGVTGSSGKTSTKNLVRDVLAAGGSVVATIANQNNELGVPNTLLAAEEDTRAVVVEMGMRGLGQIEELCSYAHPDWGLVTNVGESHIELLGSRDAIAEAKAELFAALPEGGIAFVNAADDYAKAMCDIAQLDSRGVNTVFFAGVAGQDELSACEAVAGDAPFVWAEDVSFDAEARPTFTMRARNFAAIARDGADGSCACALEVRGVHNVSNACSAAAVGLASGMTLAQCCEALAGAAPDKGRQRVLETASGLTVVDDAYNANPDSMRASLSTFAALEGVARRVAVLGDMGELGDFAPALHERVGGLAAQAGLDYLVCAGELSRSIAQSARDAGMPADAVVQCADAAEALEAVRAYVRAGDAVLVKASHAMGFDAIVEGLVD